MHFKIFCNIHLLHSVLRNPVTNKKHYRLYLIHKVPQVRVLDFQKVKLKVSLLAFDLGVWGFLVGFF